MQVSAGPSQNMDCYYSSNAGAAPADKCKAIEPGRAWSQTGLPACRWQAGCGRSPGGCAFQTPGTPARRVRERAAQTQGAPDPQTLEAAPLWQLPSAAALPPVRMQQHICINTEPQFAPSSFCVLDLKHRGVMPH